MKKIYKYLDKNYELDSSTVLSADRWREESERYNSDDDESEDGWSFEVRSALSSAFARSEDLMYEIRNTIKGAMTDCTTVEDLAEFIRELASEYEEAAREIEDM